MVRVLLRGQAPDIFIAGAEGALQVELSNAHRVIVWFGGPTCLALSGTRISIVVVTVLCCQWLPFQRSRRW